MIERSRTEILDMPVLSISEGLVLGKVRQLLIDSATYSVQGFVVERLRGSKDDRILPFSSVANFGEDGITIENQTLLEKRGLNHQFARSIRHPLPIVGARVFTAGGRTLGKVEEYRFSVEDGSITGLEISGGLFKSKFVTPGRHIIAISPQTIMMKDEAVEDATVLENNIIDNMNSGLETIKEKAIAFKNSASQTTKSITNSISEAVNKKRSAEQEENDSQTIEEELLATATEDQPDELIQENVQLAVDDASEIADAAESEEEASAQIETSSSAALDETATSADFVAEAENAALAADAVMVAVDELLQDETAIIVSAKAMAAEEALTSSLNQK